MLPRHRKLSLATCPCGHAALPLPRAPCTEPRSLHGALCSVRSNLHGALCTCLAPRSNLHGALCTWPWLLAPTCTELDSARRNRSSKRRRRTSAPSSRRCLPSGNALANSRPSAHSLGVASPLRNLAALLLRIQTPKPAGQRTGVLPRQRTGVRLAPKLAPRSNLHGARSFAQSSLHGALCNLPKLASSLHGALCNLHGGSA